MDQSSANTTPEKADASQPAGRAIADVPLVPHRNHTPFPSQYFQSVDAQGEISHVVVLRVTYDMQNLRSDGMLNYAAQQTPLVRQDAWSGAVNDSSPLWESDYAPFKPRCDVLVTNAVSRPPHPPASRWPCGLALYWRDEEGQEHRWHKTLTVTGPRRFGWMGLGEPQAATEVPLDWQHAYGGQIKKPQSDEHRSDGTLKKAAGSDRWDTDERNPVGVGLDKSIGRPAPQLEVMNRPYKAGFGQDDYPPMGLSAVGRAWLPRRQLAGTYDAAWQEQQWPLPPKDLSEDYWNCAPKDQQVDYLPPGTEIMLSHLYPPATPGQPANDSWPMHWQGRLPLHQISIRLLMRIEGQKCVHDTDWAYDTLVIDLASRQIHASLRYTLAHAIFQGPELLEIQTWLAPVGAPYELVPADELGPLALPTL